MRTLVVGAGATGGFFGARLAQAGRDVTFLVRPRRAAVLAQRGLRLVGLGGEEVVMPQLVTADRLDSPYDLVLMTVKATALPQALDDVAPAVGRQSMVVPFLNGMAHLATLDDRFGEHSVLGGVVKVMTTVNPDGDIVRLAPMASIAVGERDGHRSERLELLSRTLGGAGFDFSVSPDIGAAMWHKWVFISTLGATTCLARGTIGEVMAVPGGAELGPAILAEAAAVSAAAGYPVPPTELAGTTAMVTQSGSTAASSTYRDVTGGMPTEAEHIFGDLVAQARGLGVETPLLDLATVQLRVHEHRLASARGAAVG